MVPESLRKQVMKLGHNSIFSGHLGRLATENKIASNFFWPKFFNDVSRLVKSCDICQRTIPQGKVGKLPLGKVPLMGIPFYKVIVDLIGPLAVSDRGYRFCLTLVDNATRYPEAIPLKHFDTASVADALMSIFSRLGVPKIMSNDNGGQFSGQLLGEVARLVGVKQEFCTVYHPEAQGKVERFNGTLKSILKKLAAERIGDWDRFVDPALFSYRSCVQASTGYSPFTLM